MTGVHIKVEGLDKLINDLEDMARPPVRTAERLDELLEAAFETTQAVIHVRRGVTKATGERSSVFHGNGWSGTIEYGDPAGDVHETGAVWLLHDDEDHPDRDYLAPLNAMDASFEQAINDYFEDHIG